MDAPLVAVIVPLFKHSVLIADALASLIAQQGSVPFVIVVVNDGCPFADTQAQLAAIRALHPELIRTITRANGGLSAARNAGIDFALREFPSVAAIYFMDADNRLRPRGLEIAYRRLVSDAQADWVYPNIDMFGGVQNFDYAGPYSLLAHAFYNICEAGSLVHARVFQAGIRFDTAMRQGFEDWEFWLSAAEAGFSGVHEPHFGFLYRNRAESMLSQAKRDDAAIMAYIRAKHARLWDRRHLLELEAREAPRHAVVFVDTGEVLIGLGGAGERYRPGDFETTLWRNVISPAETPLPPILVFTTRDVFDGLAHSPMLPWALYHCQLGLAGAHLAGLELEPAGGAYFSVRPEGVARDAHLLAMTRDTLADILLSADTSWIEGLLHAAAPGGLAKSPAPEGIGADPQGEGRPRNGGDGAGEQEAGARAAVATLALPWPGDAPPVSGCMFGILFQIMRWRGSQYRLSARTPWTWRTRTVPYPHALHLDVGERLGVPDPFPHMAQPPRIGGGRARSIGFVLPIGAFGGVERVAYNTAAVFAGAGWRVHLFMLGTSRVEVPDEFSKTFETVHFLLHPMFGGWDGERAYQGTAMPNAARHAASASRIAAALGWLDVVVNHHSGDFNVAAALLRHQGVVTAAHLHLLDLTAHGRPNGHAMLALAYEHAYDLIVCGSRQLCGWMHAAGVPQDKLVLAPNAPAYAIDAGAPDKIMARRRSSGGNRLRVLHLGRLDRQKGLDRLDELIARSRKLGLPIDWRVVGAATIDAADLPRTIAAIAEPPVLGVDGLNALFAWADVMVLLSDFEGVPLSVLEAQRLGVCVIATDVGAVHEAIETGHTGFLVQRESAIEDTLDLLQILLGAPGYRTRIGQAAAEMSRDWGRSCQAMISGVTGLVEKKERMFFFEKKNQKTFAS